MIADDAADEPRHRMQVPRQVALRLVGVELIENSTNRAVPAVVVSHPDTPYLITSLTLDISVTGCFRVKKRTLDGEV